MTRDEMTDLIRALSPDELETLRYLAMFGVADWDRKTTINGKPWQCPGCGAEGLLEVVDRAVETWAAEEMTLHGDYEYDLDKSRKWDASNYGDLYFECVQCRQRFEVDEPEEMFDVHCDEEDDDSEDSDSVKDEGEDDCPQEAGGQSHETSAAGGDVVERLRPARQPRSEEAGRRRRGLLRHVKETPEGQRTMSQHGIAGVRCPQCGQDEVLGRRSVAVDREGTQS